jgi:hypothetical protein
VWNVLLMAPFSMGGQAAWAVLVAKSRKGGEIKLLIPLLQNLQYVNNYD